MALLTKTYNSGARVWLSEDSAAQSGSLQERIWFNHQYFVPINLRNQQVHYYACLLHLRMMRLIIGSEWCPTDLHFQAPKLQGLSELELFSRTKICFNQRHNAIALPKSVLYRPLKPWQNYDQSNPQDLYESLRSSAPAPDFLESLRQFIRFQLPSGYVQIEVAAGSAGISVRSLQRRLTEEGLSYSHLVDQVRFNLAVDFLKDSTINLADIAFELGYTKHGNFTRAFQRWSGVTPREYRRLWF
jgi:AraC-like DNA-binding protein